MNKLIIVLVAIVSFALPSQASSAFVKGLRRAAANSFPVVYPAAVIGGSLYLSAKAGKTAEAANQAKPSITKIDEVHLGQSIFDTMH